MSRKESQPTQKWGSFGGQTGPKKNPEIRERCQKNMGTFARRTALDGKGKKVITMKSTE